MANYLNDGGALKEDLVWEISEDNIEQKRTSVAHEMSAGGAQGRPRRGQNMPIGSGERMPWKTGEPKAVVRMQRVVYTLLSNSRDGWRSGWRLLTENATSSRTEHAGIKFEI